MEILMQSSAANHIQALLTPRSVAVFGASSRRSDATGNEVVRYLRKTGHDHSLMIVNPSGGTIEGIEATRSLDALAAPDLAIVALPPSAAVGVVEDLEEKGCPSVIVMSVGLSDADIVRLRQAHKRGRIHVHGPNCMGLINVSNGLHAWANEDNLAALEKGPVSIISQSGSGAIFVARSISGVGFSKIISTGNEAGATTADYLNILATDPDTTVIGLIIESIQSGKAFAAAARRVRAEGKRIVVLKVGRSDKGAAATKAHTGALLSSDAAYTALFEKLGIPVVTDYDELAASLEILARRPKVEASGAAILTISGGQAALSADLAEAIGVDLPTFSEESIARLAALLPDQPINNPLDLAAGPDDVEGIFRQAIEILADDPAIGVVMPILDLQDSLTASESAFEDEYFGQITSYDTHFPVVIASSSSVSIQPARKANAGGIPIVRGMRNALVGIKAAITTRSPPLAEPSRPGDLPSIDEVAALRLLLAREKGTVAPAVVDAIVTAYRLPFVESATFSFLDEARIWAEATGFPVVAKIASPDIAHRSDAGGVVIGIRNSAELSVAWQAIMNNVARHRPDARIAGIEVQKQLVNQIEAYAGFVSDPHLGSTLAVGLGGVLIELIKDVARMAAPVDPDVAARKIESSKLGMLLAGHRNLNPRTSIGPLRDLVTKLSWMAEDLGDVIHELDFNPVLIDPGSGHARLVDALIMVPARDQRADGPD
jgi:acetate---CoA ligase (ADP-forming)